MTLKEARRFVETHHRHNRPPQGWKFGVGLLCDDELIGVAVAGQPVARALDDGQTVEITRVCTLGHKNANSMLYGAITRAAKALGYRRAITYTLDTEKGSSLKATGWQLEDVVAGARDWNRPGQENMRQPMLFGERYPQHNGHKQRWVKQLVEERGTL